MARSESRRAVLLLGAAVLSLLLVTGCLSGGGSSRKPAPGSAPSVVDINPDANSTGAVISAIVLALFDREMDPSSIDSGTFTVTGPSGDLRGSISCSLPCQTAAFEPTNLLDFEESYTVTLDETIRDANGVPLTSDVIWSFSTAAELVRASTDANGTETTLASQNAATDLSGRLVAFDSADENLVFGDTNAALDVFVKDLQTGDIERISVNEAGIEGDGNSSRPAITPDGRFVAFESAATNLVPGLGAVIPIHVYVKDRESDTVTLVSANDAGTPSNGNSIDASISSDGRYVAFQSNASNLVAGVSGLTQVYVKDLETGTIEVASADASGTPADADATQPAISDNGEYVVFQTSAPNFGAAGGGETQIYRKDLVTNALDIVSETELGNLGNGPSANPSVSRFGQFVAFQTTAVNLGANGAVDQIVRKDLQSDSVLIASADTSGNRGNLASRGASISADGRYVAFHSLADLIGSNNGWIQIFVKDLQNGQSGPLDLVSENAQGDRGELGDSLRSAISRDGGYVAFDSGATNLLGVDDQNTVTDVFRGFNETFSP